MESPWSALDRHLFFSVYGGAGGSLVLVMTIVTCLGSGWMLLGLVPFFARERTRTFAVHLLATLIVTAILVFVAKLAVHRPRPAFVLAGVRALFDAPHDFSFPSGHAAGSFAFALFTGAVLRDRGASHEGRSVTSFALRFAAPAALFALASLVALSRVYLGCHFPGDVTAGALLGATCGALGARAHRQRTRATHLATSEAVEETSALLDPCDRIRPTGGADTLRSGGEAIQSKPQ